MPRVRYDVNYVAGLWLSKGLALPQTDRCITEGLVKLMLEDREVNRIYWATISDPTFRAGLMLAIHEQAEMAPAMNLIESAYAGERR